MNLSLQRPIIGSGNSAIVTFPDFNIKDVDIKVKYAELKGFVNSGYAIRVQLSNADFRLLTILTGQNSDYFYKCRQIPIRIIIKFSQSPNATYPQGMTRDIEGYLLALYSHGEHQNDLVEFIAIDPVNFALRAGDADGKAYKGNVSDVIKQIINKYAPNAKLELEDQTNDSKYNVWWTFRRSPREMLSHLITIASSLSPNKTPWIIGVYNNTIKIGPQNSKQSKNVGFYTKISREERGEIESWKSILNTSIGQETMGLITAGVSATTGKYLDQITHKDATINEWNTDKKLITKTHTRDLRSPIKPYDTFNAGIYGRSYVESHPEYHNGGESGLDYSNYYDSYARTKFIRNTYKLLTIDLKVHGHGIYDNTLGLGIDTVFIDWTDLLYPDSSYYFHGSWLVYGFKHTWTMNGRWFTELNLARTDDNALGVKVPT